jgi:hypothetical protein
LREWLFFGYFYCLTIAFTAVAMWLIGSFNHSTLEKHHHPRRTIDQTVTTGSSKNQGGGKQRVTRTPD